MEASVETAPWRRLLRRVLDLGLWGLVIGLFLWRFGPQLMAATGVGATDAPAPAFDVITLDGDHVSSESLLGKVVLINFWATWCGPCRLEMPGFQRAYDAYRDNGLVVLGLSTDVTGAAAVREYIAEHAITYPIAMAPSGLAMAFGSPRAIPTSFLIDRDGVVRYRITGYFAEPTLRAAVSRLIDQDVTLLDSETGMMRRHANAERDEGEQRIR